MIFGIDYDGTFAEDPEFFHHFIDLINQYGHQAILVTQRPLEWNHKDILGFHRSFPEHF